jgi:hypothetical protein
VRVENASRRAQRGADIAVVQQFAANHLVGPALEEDVIGHDDGRAPVDHQRLDVLEGVELRVARRGPEVVTDDGERLLLFILLNGPL